MVLEPVTKKKKRRKKKIKKEKYVPIDLVAQLARSRVDYNAVPASAQI